MILTPQDLRTLIVADTLHYLECWTQKTEDLLVGTAIQESAPGSATHTKRHLGIYRISPVTHRAIWDHYLVQIPEFASRVRGLAGQHSFLDNPHKELVTNLRYATAVALCIYQRAGVEFPDSSDIEALAQFWHRHYRAKPSGRVEEFIRNYGEQAELIGLNAA